MSARSGRLGYLPALDGLRGLAVLAVLLFHAGLGFVVGGQLGVTVFFTLSGFLITALLLLERSATGRIDLPRFWARRARRLVPATLLALPLVALVVHASPGPVSSGVLGDAIASATWVANWRFIFHHQVYADLFSMPSPFQHFWSLGVEEQFYVVFPLLLALVLGRAVGVRRRWLLAFVLTVLTVASTAQLIRLNGTGANFSRAYYGTDARVAELLVGALLALALVKVDGLRQLRGAARHATSLLGLLGMCGLVYGVATLDNGNELLFRGGFLAVAICTAAVIAAAVQHRSPLARLLAVRPLALLGLISYGVYVFHWPLFLLITEDSTGQSGAALVAMRLGATLALAIASYRLLEHPIRFGSLKPAEAFSGWAAGAIAGIAGVAAVSVAATALTAPAPEATTTSALAQAPAVASPSARASTHPVATRRPSSAPATHGPATVTPRTTRSTAAAPPVVAKQETVSRPVTKHSSSTTTVPKEFYNDPNYGKVPPAPAVPAGAFKIAVVGDSLGTNLGTGLKAWAKNRTDVAVYALAIPACPISRGRERRLAPDKEFDVDPVCQWWDDPNNDRRKALEKFAPDVIVVEDGINEVFERRRDEWGGWRSAGQPQFDSWLAQEYQSAFNQWTSGGAAVLVANTPCGDWTQSFQDVQNPEFRVSAVNAGYDRMTGITQADFFNRVCPNGQYTDTVEGIPHGRTDGFHFTDEAATALAVNWLGPIVLQTAAQHKGAATPAP